MGSEAAAEPTWRYSRLSEFSVPSEFSADAVRRLRRLWKAVVAATRLRKGDEDDEGSRASPSADLLTGFLPRFDAGAAADALASALDGWPEGDSAVRARVVVGPPGSHTREVVAALARREGWRELEPPERSELVARPEAIGDRPPGSGAGSPSPVVIAELARYLLRSERALPPLRSFLESLRDPSSHVLIGCDSWAWSFLDHTFGMGDLVGEPLALAALDGRKLADWLGPPVRSSGFVCRLTENRGDFVFAQSSGDEARGSDPRAVAPTLTRLALASRGNPGVALELWKRSLSVGSDENERESEGPGAREHALWAGPVRRSEIVVPPQLEGLSEFVLHAVLLHGGLEKSLLQQVLPFPRLELMRASRELSNQGLLAETGDRLSVPLAAYAAVRTYLGSEGFLVDAF